MVRSTDVLVHPLASASAPKGMERLHDWLKPWMPRLLGLLYAANAAGPGPAWHPWPWSERLDTYGYCASTISAGRGLRGRTVRPTRWRGGAWSAGDGGAVGVSLYAVIRVASRVVRALMLRL